MPHAEQMDAISDWRKPTLSIKLASRNAYQRTRLNAGGGIRGYLTRQKRIKGFATGDMVAANVPSGKKDGNHFGRVAVRASGSFNIQTSGAVVQGISYRHCRLVQRSDGFGYAWSIAHLNPGNFPVSSRNLPSRSRAEVAVQPCG